MAGNSMAINLLAGMKIKITIPVDAFEGEGFWAWPTNFEFQGRTINPTTYNGFWLEDENVGELSVVANELAVVYHHKINTTNKVFFKAHTEDTLVISVVSIPIHDHSSIVQGGPAFGSYFSDSAVE